MGPAVKTPADIIVIRETVKGNSDSKEMQRTATAGFYAGFVGQGIEYTQIISNADYQLSMIITSAKGVNSINNPLSYLLFIKDFSLTQTLDAAKAGLQDVWNGTYDSAIGRRIGAGTFNYLLMTIGGAQLKGKGTACEAVESGSKPENVFPENPDDLLPEIPRMKVTKANGTTSQTIQTSDNIRIRAEQHPLLPGEIYNPRHHGVHYHVDKSWNNKNNVKKGYPEGYTHGLGSGFITGEAFPE